MNIHYLKYKMAKPFLSWRNKYLKHLTQKEGQQADLYNKTVQEISEYTGESQESIKHKHHLGPQSEKKYRVFENQNNLTHDDVEGFYRDCHYYLYELPLWNAERNRPEYLCRIVQPYLKQYRCSKILDFGAGTGDLCLALASKGFEVSYCDIGAEVSNFAKWRFKRRNLPIKVFNDLNQVGNSQFDAIISFDCFEHIKDLEKLLFHLTTHLRNEGLLITSEAFDGEGLHLEENNKFKDFKTFDAMMNKANLVFVGQFAQHFFYQKKRGKYE